MTGSTPAVGDRKARIKGVLSLVPGLLGLARLSVETVRVCMRWRVTGLAAEAGFFALLSLPPLVFGLLGMVGYFGRWLGPDVVEQMTASVYNYAAQFLTDESLQDVLMPTLQDALGGGRPDVISIGFLLSLWSGSRCLNVLLDTISIMYGQGGVRGIVKTRVLSLSLYLASLSFGAVLVPLIVLGPTLLRQFLPDRLGFLMSLYWPIVGGLTVIGFATLFFIAVPQRANWTRDVPGALLTLTIWVVASFLLRIVLGASIGGTSIYGPLAATIVILIWLYFLSIGVLIGAAMNAASHRLWPPHGPLPIRERARELMDDGMIRRPVVPPGDDDETPIPAPTPTSTETIESERVGLDESPAIR
ncbi:YihY/virulence factor BrkB family protein [Dermacoccaceae bacterium W4C1]